MFRRLLMFLTAAVLAGGLALPCEASQEWGMVKVKLRYENAEAAGGRIQLYQVAVPAEGGYRLAERFGGGMVCREDALSPQLAQWLADQALGSGESRILDADGECRFGELEEGLYLLLQTEAPEGYGCALPALVPMPLNGQWEIQAEPKTAQLLTVSPQTGQSPEPLLWAMGMVLSGMALGILGDRFRRK